jgi:hypothetical protein
MERWMKHLFNDQWRVENCTEVFILVIKSHTSRYGIFLLLGFFAQTLEMYDKEIFWL